MKKVILILILQMIAVFPQLKEFEIKETSPAGSTPVFVNYPDDAAIIIYSSIENIAFESNTDGIVNVKSESGKYTIVLKTERQYITLKCRGYREEKLSVQRMNAREVKYYSVEAKKTEEDKIPVTIITEPAGAQLFIDGVFAGVSSTQMLSPGVHEVRAVMDNYKPAVKTIEVSQKNVFFTIPLEKMKVVLLEIRSTPDKAKIFIEGIEEGETNDQLFKMPGRYNIKLTKSGYLDYTSVVDVKEGAANELNAVLEKSSVNLKVNVDPSGAELKINKKIYSAGREIELAPGTYQIEIEKEGYEKLDDAVTLERGKPLTRNYKLMQQKGSLQVKVKPIDADVILTSGDGVRTAWKGSAVKEDLPAGRYNLRVTAPQYQDENLTIMIKKNETAVESVNLKEIEIKKPDKPSFVPEMVLVKGGTFMMGSNDGEDNEKPVHKVTVNDYYIGKYEVTVSQFSEFIKAASYKTDAEKGGGSYLWNGKEWELKEGVNWRCDTEGNVRPERDYNHPVIHVSWNDAKAYCEWLSRSTGRKFDLPTEAEWEFAARGGTSSRGYKYSGSNIIDEVGWYNGNSVRKTHPVGEKRANELGIYDMAGNVWEWCRDWYDKSYYAKSPERNPEGPPTGSTRVLRGGSWDYGVYSCRSAYRNWSNPDVRDSYLGFRCIEYL